MQYLGKEGILYIFSETIVYLLVDLIDPRVLMTSSPSLPRLASHLDRKMHQSLAT